MNITLMPKLVPTLHCWSKTHVEPSPLPRAADALQVSDRSESTGPLADALKTVIIIIIVTLSPSQCMFVPVSSQKFASAVSGPLLAPPGD